MPKPISITLRTLTPFWAGGVEPGRMERVHETGIIGSLRWWYEAVLRGLGQKVCDPTADERCPRKDGSCCDACWLFGTTGRSRHFRVRMEGGEPLFYGNDILLASGRLHPRRQGPDRPGGWFLYGQALTGNLDMQITPLFSTDEHIATLMVPLALIHRYAALGAKVSNGYGVVNVTRVNNEAFVISDAMLRRLPTGKNAPDTLPNLRDFFFAKVRFQEPGDNPDWWKAIPGIAEAWKGTVETNGKRVGVFSQYNKNRNDELCRKARGKFGTLAQNGLLPLAPAVRNWLRFEWKSGLSEKDKHFLFGGVQPLCPLCYRPGFKLARSDQEKQWCPKCHGTFPKGKEVSRAASKINISHAYRLNDGEWEFRIWGLIPRVPPDGLYLRRQEFIRNLEKALKDNSTWSAALGLAAPSCHLDEWHCVSDGGMDGFGYLGELLDVPKKGGTQP
jgi:CRISPR-associated protein Cmr1